MECLQTEILQIEFNEFAKGLNKISELDFAEILLRYTDFNQEKRRDILDRLETQIEDYSRVCFSIHKSLNFVIFKIIRF